MIRSAFQINPERFDAVLFDMDGVLTATAKVHARCWKHMFDDFLRARAEGQTEPFLSFDIIADYRSYVDGRPRYEGVRTFLASRKITLPEGTPDDAPSNETVCGLGNRKSALVQEILDSEGVEVYAGSLALVHQLRRQGIKTAVVTSSRGCDKVLRAGGIADLFDARVDGVVAEEQGLTGKPAPDTYLEAARLLGAVPSRTVVVEDAIVGVQAGRAGNFGLVVGVDHVGEPQVFRDNGADVVVNDLAEFLE